MEPLTATRDVCLRCRRPQSVCWCGALAPVDSRTRVVFLQHPREAKVPVSTCRMAHLSLPNSELHVGLGAAGDARLEAVCAQPGVAVLFPSDGAADVATLDAPPRTLVVVDGSWSNARKVVERCPVLSRLPRLAFTPDRPGNYRIRREPEAHCLSTIEAVAHVLERLERAPGRFVPILRAFDTMVDRQLGFISATGNRSRHRRKKVRNSVRVDPTAPLRARAAHFVVVFGEANAWPADRPDRPPDETPELIQLVALRLATSERFDALLMPRRPLSPSVPFHLDLPREAIESAEPRPAALARWRGFLRSDDVLVGWGGFCRDLLSQEGLAPAAFFDLRSALAQVLSGRPGSVEACAARLGVELPGGRGRAARRLEALRAVTGATASGAMQAVLRGVGEAGEKGEFGERRNPGAAPAPRRTPLKEDAA